MRLDRAITLGLARPLRALLGLGFRPSTFDPRPSHRVLPVLMYHSISDDPEPGVRPYYRVCTSPRRFAEHMALLKSLGYRGVTLSEGLEWLDQERQAQCAERRAQGAEVESGKPKAEFENRKSKIENAKPVALTFDDGFRDFYTAAAPVLADHGFRATMYLPTAFIGTTRRVFAPGGNSTFENDGVVTPHSALRTPRLAPSRSCLTWSEVQELHQAGFEFGSHTVNHPKLVELPWTDIEFELRNSKLEIEQRLGCAAPAFAYPYAFPQADREFVTRFCDLLGKAGYQSNVTTRIGRARLRDDRFRLARLPVNEADDARLFTAKLAGAYDWLASAQAGFKRLKRAL